MNSSMHPANAGLMTMPPSAPCTRRLDVHRWNQGATTAKPASTRNDRCRSAFWTTKTTRGADYSEPPTFLRQPRSGPAEAADQAIATVTAIHDRVTGTTADGVDYRANDPHLLAWVHVAEVDSFLRAHDRYGESPLEGSDRDRYVAESGSIAARLGADPVPTTEQGVADLLNDFRSELLQHQKRKRAARYLLIDPPLPASSKPAASLQRLAPLCSHCGLGKNSESRGSQSPSALRFARQVISSPKPFDGRYSQTALSLTSPAFPQPATHGRPPRSHRARATQPSSATPR